MQALRRLIAGLTRHEFANKTSRLVAAERYLELLHGKEKLTDDICLHTALLVNGRWSSSRDGLWQIAKKDDVLSITIDWREIPLRQIWQFKKIENGFNWVVFMDVKKELKIGKMLCGIMLRRDYEQWFSASEAGGFPAFNNSWENIFLQDVKGNLLAVNNVEGLPAVVYENLQHGELLLQNAPQACSSRALRIEVDNHEELFAVNRYKVFNSNIFILEGEKFPAFLAEKNKQLLKTRQLEEGNLRLLLGESSAHLFWGELQLTANQGLHTALLVNNEWFDSSKCEWKIERINDRCVYVDVDWRPLPIRQSWQIDIINGSTFSWKVRTQLKEKRQDLIRTVSLGLVLRPEYEKWFGGYESGCFPAEFSGWREMIEDETAGAVGVMNHAAYPGVILKNAGNAKSRLLVQNGDGKSKARFVQSVIIKNEKIEEAVESEFDLSQEITIVDVEKYLEGYLKERLDEKVMRRGISSGGLKLISDNGKMRMFWHEKEITADIGLHTAICSSGQWYDSGKMKWQVNKVSAQRLQVKVDFSPFPVVQTWDLYFTAENTICWDVSMDIAKAVEIDERKAGIILSGKYREWFNSFEQGEFPERFTFWHDIIRNRDAETFGTYPEDGFPGVMFTVDDDHLSLIQNTDENIKGRVFQGQLMETEQTKAYPAQETLVCFKGRIKLVEDRKEIDEHRATVQPLLSKVESVYFYGDSPLLHERIAGVNEFEAKVNKLKTLIIKGESPKVGIGVSRYNFFRLHEILRFVADLQGKKIDVRSFKLTVFPLRRLRRNFIEYLEELKKAAKEALDIEFVLVDEELFNIIISISSQAEPGNERQLLRLLGVICEHAFIGPQIVVIDPYHCCNANCVHCWVHTPGVYHNKEFYEMKLNPDSFKKIADDLSDLLVDLIIFQGDGEPLMHEKFFDMVRYARNKGIKASFFTNGILLDKNVADQAVELGIDEIFCSLPAATPATFAKINTKQKPEGLSKILDNLTYLCRLKKKEGKNNPRLIMTHVIHTMNAHELMEMAKNDVKIGADVMRFYLIRLDKNIEFLKLKPSDVNAIRSGIAQVKEYVKDKNIKLLDTTEFQLEHFDQQSGNWSENIFLEKGCTLGWNFCLIPASGEVSFCCHLRTVGYLKENSFKEIWDSENYRQFRYQAKFLKQNRDAEFLNGHPLFDDYCRHCDTHQVIRDVWEQFKLYNLERFHTK
ncbi:MAG: radical SAM protein [Candidatus Omnitrophica bacterium]|nr:radical SAM protein [Candidatus Omnitrophota bacterium]